MSSLSSFPPALPQPCLNVPVLSEFLRGEEGYCRVWLRTEMNKIHEKLMDSLFHGQNGSSSSLSSSSSAALPQHRATEAELCELLEGKKVETRIVMRDEMDGLVNGLFEGLTNKLRAYSDLDRSVHGAGESARVDSLDDDQLEPSSDDHQPNAFVLPQQQPISTWKPRLFTQHEMDTEFEEGNVAELFAELGLPYNDEQQSNHHHNNTQQLEELEEGKDEYTRVVEGGHGDGKSASVAKKRMTDRSRPEVEEEVVDVSDDDDDDLGPSWSVKRLRTKRPTLSRTRKVKQIITVTLQCDQADCLEQLPKDQFNQHMWDKHSIRLARCLVKDCKQSFVNKYILTQHLKQSHQSTSQWHCDKCEQHFTDYAILSQHNVQYHQLGQFQCSFPACTFTAVYKQKVYSHYAAQHK